MKYVFLLSIIFLQTIKSTAINYTWTGNKNSVWSNANNWIPAGIPDTSDKAIIVPAINNPVLDGNKTIKYFEISEGTIDLNGYVLKIINEGDFISGNINNGNIIFDDADKIEFGDSLGGPLINANITAYAKNILISNTTFNNVVELVKTGGSSNECEGGNIFNAKATIRNSSSYHWRFANTIGDIFNDDLEIYNDGNSFTSIAYNGNNFFYGNIIINSTAGTGIRFGQNNGISTLADGKTISIGSDGFTAGNLTLKNFIQSGNTAQNINVAAGSVALYLEEGTIFNGSVSFSFPQIYLNGAAFYNAASIEKNGNTGNTSSGGNNFFADVTII